MPPHATSGVGKPAPAESGALWSRRRVLVAIAGAAGVAASGCASPDSTKSEPFGGSLLDPPYSKPDVTLTTMDGQPFPLRKATAGRLMLLYLGYTHCPDQCPIWLNSVARAREQIGSGTGSRLQVLFVGVDLKRDTPDAMRKYLGAIDPTFTGLTGTPDAIASLNKALYFAPVQIGEPDGTGDYEVRHYARPVAYSPDNMGHRLYGWDTPARQLKKDLPRLATGVFQ